MQGSVIFVGSGKFMLLNQVLIVFSGITQRHQTNRFFPSRSGDTSKTALRLAGESHRSIAFEVDELLPSYTGALCGSTSRGISTSERVSLEEKTWGCCQYLALSARDSTSYGGAMTRCATSALGYAPRKG